MFRVKGAEQKAASGELGSLRERAVAGAGLASNRDCLNAFNVLSPNE